MTLLDDLRFAARSLARRPALLTLITLTLSIGIAANAVMFGVVDQLLLQPPPHVASPETAMRIWFDDVGERGANVGQVTTYPVVTALRENAPAFSEVAGYSFRSDYSLGTGAEARNVSTQMVSGNYFRLLGVRPALGRLFTDDDDRIPVGEPVIVVSHGFWQQELGGTSDAIGRVLPLQGKSFTVIGVAPRGFGTLDRERIDVWFTIAGIGNDALGEGWHNTTNNWWVRLVGRVRPGESEIVAQAQATSTYRALLEEWKHRWRDPARSGIVLASVAGGREPSGLSVEGKVSLWLLGVSAIVLLIACANVANLLIARTVERHREIAVRVALGVGRARLVQLLLAEAALLAAAGAAVAVVIALAGSRLVQRVFMPDIVWNPGGELLDGRVLAFTLGVTVACILLAGLAPALQALGLRVSESLKASARTSTSRRSALRFTLLLAQTALSVMLLVGAGLFVKSLRNVVNRDVGIDRDRVLRATMPLSRFGFDTSRIEEIYRGGAERVGALPGVSHVAVGRLSIPMGGASARGFSVPGVERPNLALGGPYNAVVTPGFFETIGASLTKGRDFTDAEGRAPSRVVIVNEVLANAYWPNQEALGQCVYAGSDETCSTVVGVVQTIMQFSVISDERAIVYAPPTHPGFQGARPAAMFARLAPGAEAASMIGSVRRELQALDPAMPFVRVASYDELVAPQLRHRRLGATMFSVFGIIALIIAAVGLYSVMAYWVSQRTQEIGVRMALGAQRSDVVRLVAWQSSRAVLAGIVVGGAAAAFASRWAVGMLYETSPREPMAYAGAALVLMTAAIVASIVPAQRSAAVDPSTAMRAE